MPSIATAWRDGKGNRICSDDPDMAHVPGGVVRLNDRQEATRYLKYCRAMAVGKFTGGMSATSRFAFGSAIMGYD